MGLSLNELNSKPGTGEAEGSHKILNKNRTLNIDEKHWDFERNGYELILVRLLPTDMNKPGSRNAVISVIKF